MKQATYGYTMAPDLVCDREEALMAFIRSSTRDPEQRMAMVKDWAAGLDRDDSEPGQAFRESVESNSGVFIRLEEPPPPPPPPVMVAPEMTEGQARAAARTLRAKAIDVAPPRGTVDAQRTADAAELDAIAARIEAAFPLVPA